MEWIAWVFGGIGTLMGTAVAVYQTRMKKHKEDEMKRQEAKAKEEETKLRAAEHKAKVIADKHDGGKVFRRFMMIIEEKFDGYNERCGACGGDVSECSKTAHEQRKLDATLKLMLTWCKEHDMTFDYCYWVGQYNEERFFMEEYKKYLWKD